MTNPKPKSKPNHLEEYTDKRTGIVYTPVVVPNATKDEPAQQSHLDAFIPAAFLKTYFAGKSKI
jgi:hypothetical protein